MHHTRRLAIGTGNFDAKATEDRALEASSVVGMRETVQADFEDNDEAQADER